MIGLIIKLLGWIALAGCSVIFIIFIKKNDFNFHFKLVSGLVTHVFSSFVLRIIVTLSGGDVYTGPVGATDFLKGLGGKEFRKF